MPFVLTMDGVFIRWHESEHQTRRFMLHSHFAGRFGGFAAPGTALRCNAGRGYDDGSLVVLVTWAVPSEAAAVRAR